MCEPAEPEAIREADLIRRQPVTLDIHFTRAEHLNGSRSN